VNLAQWIGSSITRRIAATTVLLTMSIVAVLGIVSYQNMRSYIRETIDATLQDDADHIAVHVERLLHAINENAESIAGNYSIANALQDAEGRSSYLVPFFLSYQLPEQVSFTVALCDLKGEFIAGNAQRSPHASLRDKALLEQVARRGVPYAAMLPNKKQAGLRIAHPVRPSASMRPQGMLVIDILLDDVFNRAWREEGRHRSMNVSYQYGDARIWERTTFAEKNAVTYSRPLHHLRPPLAGLSLAITVSEPADKAFQPLERLTLHYVLAGLFALLLTLVLARLLAGRISRPLRSLTETAKEVTGSGSLAVAVGPHGPDEVGALGKAFGTMLSRLREATEGLERRVQERTRELEHAYEDLKTEKIFSDSVIDSLPGVFYVYDEQGHLLRWNKNNERVSGYSADELSRIHMGQLVPPEERAHLAAKMREVFSTGYAETKVSVLSKTGKRTPFVVTGIKAEIGGRPLLIGTGLDISKQKRAEAALIEEKNKSEAIIAAIGDGISVQDANFKVLYQNAIHKQLVGEHLQEYCYRAYQREDDVCDGCPVALSFRDGKVHTVERTSVQGGVPIYVEVTASPLRDASGKIIGGIEVVRNITGRRRDHEALRESEEKFRALIESTSDWIWEIDTSGRYTYSSPKIRDILGYEPGEVLGKTPFDLMPAEEADRLRPQVMATIAAQGVLQGLENTAVHKDGRRVTLETSGVPVFARNGQWQGYRGIDRDITGRKRAEGALEEMNRTLHVRIQQEVEKNREKDRLMMVQSRQAAMGEMLGNIAHQWRQPLNIVGLIIQDIHDAQAHGQLTPDYLEKSVRRGMDVIQHMSQTIDDFRTFYRTDKEKQTFVLNEIVDRVFSFVESSFRNSQLVIDVKMPAAVTATGYPNEFAQVLLNILNNAKDVLLERRVRSPRIAVHVFSDQGRSVVTIADNAGGIIAEDLDRVFEPFFTTKDEGKGTGIGLYLSKIIIEKNMSGRLTARNIAGGAEFRIEV
jgi:PAS domain S-box-containing protein